ncbi:unnamed protein product [Rhizophagus irregularis]|nr:unnamed protein product [Rhizophagus irregularis]
MDVGGCGNGRALSQKRFPRMTLICPEIIRDKGLLAVSAPDKEPLYIGLNIYPNTVEFSTCSSQVCGDKIQTCTGGNQEVEPDCFRGNFLIKGTKEFEEDQWKFVKFDEQVFKIIGPCRRCNMTCINHKTAEVAKEPYSTLALCRQFNGKIHFGQHMIHVPELSEKPYLIKSNSLVQIFNR